MYHQMTIWLTLLLALDPSSEATRVRASMQAGIEAQAKSVALQVNATRPERAPARPAGFSIACDPLPIHLVEALIASAAKEYDVRPALVREVARQESGFRPCAVSHAGAQGMMQLMPATQTALGVRDPFNPAENIDAGVRLLRQLLDRYRGNLGLALGAYNAGTVAVDENLRVPKIPETQSYVRSILARLPGPSTK
jgi:soluble lytic murein transglycosylase-like protein